MDNKSESKIHQSSRREMLKNAGRIVLPTLATFQMTALKVRASGKLDLPPGDPF